MTSESIIAQSDRYIAGGVVSMNRKATPHLVFVRAEGSHIFDANGRSYIDYHAAFAPHLLGHHHPEVTAAVREARLHLITVQADAARAEIDLALVNGALGAPSESTP